MRIPMTWLNDYVDLGNTDIKTFMERMTMSGSMTEGHEALGADIKGVVTGLVTGIDKHPNADRLSVITVDIGRAKPVGIVTAATNLKVGDYVPAALDGAVLAGGKTISAGDFRGIMSEGMLCAIEELGYSRDSYPEAPEDGIYVFTEAVPLGADPAPILQLREDVVEFELTSNRADCFSLYGIAREAAATFNVPLKSPETAPAEQGTGSVNDHIKVRIDAPDKCYRYCARVVTDVKIEPSPQWLRHRLTAAGLKPINNIVDITNYVMHEMGQPMHAFDIGCVRGGEIIVRNARENEELVTLDGVTRGLTPDMLVIADSERGLAIAGIMGGEDSKITGSAGAVLLESAAFEGISVRQTSKKLGMRTDSSAKFEKRLDPNLALTAINRAAVLIEQIGAGKVVPGVVDCYPKVVEGWSVNYSAKNINALIGINLSNAEVEGYLGRLGIAAKNGTAHIPTFRSDITVEADLIEEVARLYGYDNIETTLAGSFGVGRRSPIQVLRGAIREAMAALGYHEALTFSFESPAVFDKLLLSKDSVLRRAAAIKNPLGEEYSIMRTTTVPSMLQNLATNFNYRSEEAALYEIARVYLPEAAPMDKLPAEAEVLTFAAYGKKEFFDIKGAAEYILQKLGIDSLSIEYANTDTANDAIGDLSLPFLHPGRKAVITINGAYAGYLGEVHPLVTEEYGISSHTFICVMHLDRLSAHITGIAFNPLPKFPAMRRDIALILDEAHTAGSLLSAIRETAREHALPLEDAALFDAYQGAGIEAGKRSLAFSLYLRHPERTLTDAEAQEAVQRVLDTLNTRFGAVLRS